MKVLHYIAFGLLVIGGLNWLLTAFGWNAVERVLGAWPVMERAAYVLVGLAAVWEVVMHAKNCKACGAGGTPMM